MTCGAITLGCGDRIRKRIHQEVVMHAKLFAALSRRHRIGILVAGAAGLALTDAAAVSARGDSRRPGVTHLEIDGRSDEPLGVDDVTPRRGRWGC